LLEPNRAQVERGASVAYYAELGIRIERVMTDDGSCYQSKDLPRVQQRLGLRQVLTKPYTPRTNGKAERFIQNGTSRMGAVSRAFLCMFIRFSLGI
jgi:transposase InsO family protein